MSGPLAASLALAPMAVASGSAAAAVTGTGPWTTFTAPTDVLAHQINVKNNTANNHSGKTLTFTGTDADGNALTESGVTGPAGSATITTTKYFKTLTQISISAGIGADTFDIGYALTATSQTYPLNIGAT